VNKKLCAINFKKVIAREFLFIVTGIILFLIGLISLYIFQEYKDECVDEISNEIKSENILKSEYFSILESKKNKKQDYFIYLFKRFDLVPSDGEDLQKEVWTNYNKKINGNEKEYREWFKDLAEDLKITNNAFGLKNDKTFKEFIIENTITKQDSLKYNKSYKKVVNLIRKREILISEQISHYEYYDYLWLIFTIIMIILFGVRYLYYATKWSINTLKI
jgi:hypothetical protein